MPMTIPIPIPIPMQKSSIIEDKEILKEDKNTDNNTDANDDDNNDDRELRNDCNITAIQPSENIIAINKRCHHSRLISMNIDTNHHDTTSSFTLRQHDDNGYDPNNDNNDHDTDVYPFLLNRQMIPHAANY